METSTARVSSKRTPYTERGLKDQPLALTFIIFGLLGLALVIACVIWCRWGRERRIRPEQPEEVQIIEIIADEEEPIGDYDWVQRL